MFIEKDAAQRATIAGVRVLMATMTLAGAAILRAEKRAVEALPEVEVSARRDQAGAERLERVPGGVNYIGRGGFGEGRASSFDDFLGASPGIYFARSSGDEITKISMRGSGIQSDEALGVQILLDGLAYNQGDGEANLEEIALGTIAAAEVYRGANAWRYGGYVLGGAINLIARTGYDSPGATARVETGSFGYRRGEISGGFVHGDADVFAGASARESTGYREHSGERTKVFSGRMGFRAGPVENRFYLGLADWNRAVPGELTAAEWAENPRQADPEAVEGNFRIETRSVRLADRLVFTAANPRVEAGAFYHHRNFLLMDAFEDDYRAGATEAYSDNIGAALNATWRGDGPGRGYELTIGAAPGVEWETSANYAQAGGVIDRTQRTAAGVTRSINAPFYMEATLQMTERFAWALGGQYVYTQRRFDDRFWSDEAGNQSAQQAFRAFNPKLGFTWATGSAGTLFGNVSRSFQPPSMDDLNPFEEGESGSVIYTPLAAQTAWTAEVGHRGRRGRWQWDAALYQADVRGELLELNDAAGRPAGTVNTPRSRHRGVELGVDVDLWMAGASEGDARLTLSQDYTWNDFRFDHDPVYGNNRIAGVPEHLYHAELVWRGAAGFYLGPRVEWSWARCPVDQANTVFAPRYIVWGLKAGFRGRRGFTCFVEARNIADRRYASAINPIADARTADADELRVFSPGDGRAFYGGVAWVW